MPWTEGHLPFQGSVPLSAQCSYKGAEDAQGRAENQSLRLLEAYAKYGPLSDWQAARLLGLERTSINARRVPLVKRGIVVAVDAVKNAETGIANTRWGLQSGSAQ